MNRSRGYTLVELLLYCAIIGTLLIVSTGFFMMVNATHVKGRVISEVEQQGGSAIETITQIVRNAGAINSPLPGVSGSSLSVDTQAAVTTPTIIGVDGSALTIKEGAADPIPLTNGNVEVTQFTVKNLSPPSTPGIVRVTLTLNYDNPSGRQEFDYSRTFITSAARRE